MALTIADAYSDCIHKLSDLQATDSHSLSNPDLFPASVVAISALWIPLSVPMNVTYPPLLALVHA